GSKTCTVTAQRQVALQLDAGDPGPASALGPRRIADQVTPCELAIEPDSVFVAIAGRAQLSVLPAARMPQRVKSGLPKAASRADCRGRLSGEFLPTVFGLASAKFAVVGSSTELDLIEIVFLDAAEPSAVVLDASLTWDDRAVGC